MDLSRILCNNTTFVKIHQVNNSFGLDEFDIIVRCSDIDYVVIRDIEED